MNEPKQINQVQRYFSLQGLLIEMFITYVLVTVIVQVALDTKSKTGLAPILIGLTLSGNILAVLVETNFKYY